MQRQERDARYLAAMEEITQTFRRVTEKYLSEEKESEFQTQWLRFQRLENIVASERRLLEDLSLPCRLVLEHFTSFLGHADRSISVRFGQCQYAGGIYLGYTVNEWGHITLNLGNYSITWRDDDYQYMFYADKIVLRAYDIQKPEIAFSFTFSLKYSKLLEEYQAVSDDEQTAYCQPDLFDDCSRQE